MTRLVKLILALLSSYTLSLLAVVESQGQAVATLTGTTGAIAVQNSVSGNGYNAGLLRVLSGAAPANANAAETGTLGVSQAMPNPAFGAPSGLPSVANANAITNVAITATITAGYARLVENADTFGLSTTLRRLQFAVGTSGSDLNLNTLSLVSGGTFSTTSLSVQAP